MTKTVTTVIFKITLIVSVIFLGAWTTYASSEGESTVQNSKIEPEVLEAMNSAEEDEIISVRIWLESIDFTEIDELLQGVSDYEERLALIENTYEAVINAFVERHLGDGSRSKLIYCDIYDSAIVIKALKADILEYAEDKEVENISLYYYYPFAEESKAVLIEAQSVARMELRYYKDLSVYREAQQNELHAIIDQGILDINECEQVEDIKIILESAEVQMDAVKTDQQLSEEEKAQEEETESPEEDKDQAGSKPDAQPEEEETLTGEDSDAVSDKENIPEYSGDSSNQNTKEPNQVISDKNVQEEEETESIIQPEVVEQTEYNETTETREESKEYENKLQESTDDQISVLEKYFPVIWIIVLIVTVLGSIGLILKRK